MYRFEINSTVDVFDLRGAFTAEDPKAAWRHVPVKEAPNSPFTQRLAVADPASCCREQGDQRARCERDFGFDAFKLYPNNYLLPDGRILLTREGEWVNLRTDDATCMRRTRQTYFASLGRNRQEPKICFELGPLRAEETTSYGTSFRDPNNPRYISIVGGPNYRCNFRPKPYEACPCQVYASNPPYGPPTTEKTQRLRNGVEYPVLMNILFFFQRYQVWRLKKAFEIAINWIPKAAATRRLQFLKSFGSQTRE